RTRRHFVRSRFAISGRATFNDVQDKDLLALQSHPRDHLVQQITGAADERAALEVFVFAGAFADEHNLGVGIAFAEDRVRSLLAQPAARAALDLVLVQLAQAE